ncbi:unnamed protein product [Cuscuta campestris]|uniref:Uncharacterized protein n=1 Tax=Cuscuta campestris TaxID=132261 RepID=A0A484MEA8_9ASTE|nr:unnamed protein product [Cuscuta campestris]
MACKLTKYDVIRTPDEDMHVLILCAAANGGILKRLRNQFRAELEKPQNERPKTAAAIHEMMGLHITALTNSQRFQDKGNPPFCFTVAGWLNSKDPFIFKVGFGVPDLDPDFKFLYSAFEGSGSNYAEQIFNALLSEAVGVEMDDNKKVPVIAQRDAMLWAKKIITFAALHDPRTGGILHSFTSSARGGGPTHTQDPISPMTMANPDPDAILQGLWTKADEREVQRWLAEHENSR